MGYKRVMVNHIDGYLEKVEIKSHLIGKDKAIPIAD